MLSSRPLGLAAVALVFLAAAHPAAAQAPASAAQPSLAATSCVSYVYDIAFTTPDAFRSAGSGNILLLFSPDGPNPASATLTGGNLSYSNDWKVGSVSTFGDATPYYSFGGPITGPDVIIGNTKASNGALVGITQFGTSFNLVIEYQDPPGTDPTDFSLALQSPGLADAGLFDIRFTPGGPATLMSSASGVAVTPETGTPGLSSPAAVPEASTTVSLGLLMVLGMGGMVVAAKRRKTTS